MWADLDDEVGDTDLLGIDLTNINGSASSPTASKANHAKSTTSDKDNTKSPSKTKSSNSNDSIPRIEFIDPSIFGNERRLERREAGESPLDVFRGGYLWVSDFSKQAWCEQQVEYSYTAPIMGITEESPVMTAGSEFHLARELAVPDIVTVGVKVTSREDTWAIKILNLIEAIDSLSKGAPVRREIPIFGCLNGTFVAGIIDEIRVDEETFSFEILELKTRQSQRVPSKAQKLTHDIQVMLYKRLFDDLVCGKVNVNDTVRAFRLRQNHELGADILDMTSSLPTSPKTIGNLLRYLFDRMQGLPFIAQCLVEYCYQQDKSTIAIQAVEYDADWLDRKLDYYLEYWQSQRAVQGVDIEDAWKCQRCDFAEICEWRQRKAVECRNKKTSAQINRK